MTLERYPDSRPLTGRELAGRYRIGALLGEGGVARVYRAMDRQLNRMVAVKVFRPSMDEIGRRRFDQEAQVLAALRHPGLVKLFDAGTDDGRAFLVMDLIDGPTLLDVLCDQPLTPIAVARLGTRLAEALAYVHAKGVVHRDVKPSNILLDIDELPHLADFGFARAVDVTGVSPTGQIVGTAAYLAPEQVRGQSVAAAADVYALGLVLLECLTGELEYEGPRVEAALARLSRQPRIPANLPAPLAAALVSMTRLEPGDRPTARACATMLAQVTERLATRNGVLSVSQLRQRRTAAVVAVAALGVTALLLSSPRSPSPPGSQPHADQPPVSSTMTSPTGSSGQAPGQQVTRVPMVSNLDDASSVAEARVPVPSGKAKKVKKKDQNGNSTG